MSSSRRPRAARNASPRTSNADTASTCQRRVLPYHPRTRYSRACLAISLCIIYHMARPDLSTTSLPTSPGEAVEANTFDDQPRVIESHARMFPRRRTPSPTA